MDGLQSIQIIKSANDGIDIVRVQFYAVAPPSGFLGRDERGSAAGKRIQHDALALGAVEDRVGHEGERLYGGVHREIVLPFRAEGVRACISPDIGSVAAKSAQFDVVDVELKPFLNTKTSSC